MAPPDENEEAAQEHQATPRALINPNLRLPPELNLLTGNVSENYKSWKRQVEIYLIASGTTALSEEIQTATIINCGGERLLKIYDHFEWAPGEDKNKPQDVFNKIEQYCNPRKNEVAESHKFWSTKYFEPFDQFLTELRIKAASCNFKEEDRMIRDKIVFSCTGKMQQLLLRDDDLDLKKAIKICQSYEQANRQAEEMKKENNASVHKVSESQTHRKTVNKVPYKKQGFKKPQDKEKSCKFCGTKHPMKKESCPAWGKTCNKCHGRNHFSVKCKKINLVDRKQYSDSSDEDEYWLNVVNCNKTTLTAVMSLNNCDVRFQLDSGAQINTLQKKYVRKDQVRPSASTLRVYDSAPLKTLGEVDLPVTNPKTKEVMNMTFAVVSNKLQSLLGLHGIQKMNLITVNEEKFISKVDTSASELGDLGEATLVVDSEIQPKTLPCRKLPLAIKDNVKTELDNLVKRGILVPVTTPTKWVNQMAVVHKANGKLRICLDPQALNSALLREHYKLPVLDDVLPKLQKAKLFSKLDVKEAYWHVKLDEKSSMLTTMITPFGRYRWSRLPFGLKVSSEIFQRKLTEALGDIEGVFTIADDIIVTGCGDTIPEAELDNTEKLKLLYSRCKQANIILNDDKKEIGLREIKFHGHKITSEGVKADDGKVKAIIDMPSPTDISGVKRFCGMVQYMSKFLPSLSTTLEPLRTLTRKDTPWTWTKKCEKAFNDVKKQLTCTPVLAYFNPDLELTLQTDSSKDGLGAVLLQNGKPIEYASRSLSMAQRKWAQIEKEALSILFGLEKFDQYTYGRKVVIENDHKPLEAILRKPLSAAPRRLQDIMMKLNRYDITFKFVKGEDLIIADMLSRATIEVPTDDRPRIMTVCVDPDLSDVRLDEIRKATEMDSELQCLIANITDGWPDRKNLVEESVKQYYDLRETLSVYNGIVVKGEAIVIPKSLRSDVKHRLHSAHLGYDSMIRRARGTVFWPNMQSDIKQLADNCYACQEMKPRPSKTPLTQHDDGTKPWNKIGLYFFQIKNHTYLVSVDYFSNYIDIALMPTTTSVKLIKTLKKQFSHFGIPSVIVTDGGPQFTSSEFKKFTTEWGIKHVTSSPNHQRANGKAESAVKIMKHLIMKCDKESTDQFEALLEQRNTPRQDTGLSPCEMMFGRHTRTKLPKLDRHKTSSNRKRQQRKKSVKRYYDRTAHEKTQLKKNQNVFFERKSNEKWILGKIVDCLHNQTYIVQSEDGTTYRRNRLHIRPTKVKVVIRDKSPVRFESRKQPVESTQEDNSDMRMTDFHHEPRVCIEKENLVDRNPSTMTNSPLDNSESLDETVQQSQADMVPEPIPLRRSARARREPAKLKDYVRY
ncbi:uncharacterized protein K02A2.6-like [Saccostrea cucullata]|uniref:uncharacterized protein K02A2.6-like n=1 Tax=Saccostrea cuccullata TaxID=36930 RepID=UPI002ED67EE1